MPYNAQVFWEDVKEGQDIPKLVKVPTHMQMLMWGGAVDDYNPMHADIELAHRAGFKEPIVFGPLIFSFLEQMLTDWMGPDGWINKITVRHNNPAYPDDNVTCNGKVVKKYKNDGEGRLDLEIEADYTTMGPSGTVGSATVTLPFKSQAYTLPKPEPIPNTSWFNYGKE